MSGAIALLPQYAFMAWCSVKARGQLYLYLLHNCSPKQHFSDSGLFLSKHPVQHSTALVKLFHFSRSFVFMPFQLPLGLQENSAGGKNGGLK
jgi:hypothetical protein